MSIGINLINDDTEFVPELAKPCRLISLNDCLDRDLLVSPDTGASLVLDEANNSLSSGLEEFPLFEGCPQLYPSVTLQKLESGKLPLSYDYDALNQYIFLSQIKQHGNVNASVDSTPAKRLHWRTVQACKELVGTTLDIGCDSPSYSGLLLPKKCEYLGLDPYLGIGEFRVIALGEIIPIRSGAIDNILFNTSLDHILDYLTAIKEAHRVLRIGGNLVINTYAWLEKATLLTDSVHFHHFFEFQIVGALEGMFNILEIRRYECPKRDTHRYTLIVKAEKG